MLHTNTRNSGPMAIEGMLFQRILMLSTITFILYYFNQREKTNLEKRKTDPE